MEYDIEQIGSDPLDMMLREEQELVNELGGDEAIEYMEMQFVIIQTISEM